MTIEYLKRRKINNLECSKQHFFKYYKLNKLPNDDEITHVDFLDVFGEQLSIHFIDEIVSKYL